jgi:hypothetical protein
LSLRDHTQRPVMSGAWTDRGFGTLWRL